MTHRFASSWVIHQDHTWLKVIRARYYYWPGAHNHITDRYHEGTLAQTPLKPEKFWFWCDDPTDYHTCRRLAETVVDGKRCAAAFILVWTRRMTIEVVLKTGISFTFTTGDFNNPAGRRLPSHLLSAYKTHLKLSRESEAILFRLKLMAERTLNPFESIMSLLPKS